MLCLPEVDVVVLRAAIDVDRSRACIPYRIGHDDVGWDGEQNLRSIPDSDGPQKPVETHPRTAEADRILDAHRASEGLFVLFDLCSLHKLCGSQQIAQSLSTIGPSSRPSEQSQTALQMRGRVAV